MIDDKLPWAKWFWRDWQADLGLRSCSLAARGLWMEMLCVAAQAEEIGYVTVAGQALDTAGIARLVGAPIEEVQRLLDELETHRVFSRNRDKTIYSRRIVREGQKRERLRKTGGKGGAASKRNRSGIFRDAEQKKQHGAEHIDEHAREWSTEQRHEHGPEPQRPEARGQRPESKTTSAASVAARVLPNTSEEDARWQRLATDVNEVFERISVWPMTPILHFDSWRQRGYDPVMVLEVVRRGIKRDTRTLTYFDKALDEEHRKRKAAKPGNGIPPRYVVDVDPVVGWETALAANRRGGTWMTAWGPPPDQPGCRAPRDLLTKHFPDRYPPLHQGGNA